MHAGTVKSMDIPDACMYIILFYIKIQISEKKSFFIETLNFHHLFIKHIFKFS